MRGLRLIYDGKKVILSILRGHLPKYAKNRCQFWKKKGIQEAIRICKTGMSEGIFESKEKELSI